MKMYDRQGTAADVPDDQVGEALRSGQYGLARGRVNVVNPDGRTGSLSTQNLLKALDRGWELEGEEEKGERLYGDREIAAGAAGIARGATLGLSDVVLTKSGLVAPETLKGIQDHNEAASILGEVSGAVGSALIPGGQTNLAAKVLKGIASPSRFVTSIGANTAHRAEGALLKYLTEKTAAKELVRTGQTIFGPANASMGQQALARAAAYAASGVVEGSLFGAGQAISEKALGHPETVGELLVAHMGAGAIAGGVAGGIFGGVGAFGEKALRRLQGTAEVKLSEVGGAVGHKADELSSNARRAADTEAFEQVGISSDALQNLAKKKGKNWEPKARYAMTDEGVHPDGAPIYQRGQTSEETIGRLSEAVEHNGERIGGFYESLDDSMVTVDDILRRDCKKLQIRPGGNAKDRRKYLRSGKGELKVHGEAQDRVIEASDSVRGVLKDYVDGESVMVPSEILQI